MFHSEPESLCKLPKKQAFGAYIEVNKSRTEWYIDHRGSHLARKIEENVFVLAPLLFINKLARGVVYDVLVMKAGFTLGDSVELYCEDQKYTGNNVDPGLKILDFRRPRLGERIEEERKRIEMTKPQGSRLRTLCREDKDRDSS